MNDLVVLIPYYNDVQRLRTTLGSLANAEGGFDVLVVDDGSQRALTLEELSAHNFSLNILRLDQNYGISFALNEGLKRIFEASYRYTARLDCGDTISPNRFIRQVQCFDDNKKLGLVGSWVKFCDERGNDVTSLRLPTEPRKISKYLHRRAVLIHPAVVFSNAALRTVGFYDARFEPAEDYELFFRLTRRGFEACNVPEFLTVSQANNRGISTMRRKEQMIKKLQVQYNYFRFTGEAFLGILLSVAGLLLPYGTIKALNSTRLGKKLTFRNSH